MRNFSACAIGAALAALVTTVLAIGGAAAADVPEGPGLEEVPPPGYRRSETYPSERYIEEGFVEPPPRAYGYAAPPPAVAYAPPPVVYYAYRPRVVLPPPAYYIRPYAYRAPVFVGRYPARYAVRPWRR